MHLWYMTLLFTVLCVCSCSSTLPQRTYKRESVNGSHKMTFYLDPEKRFSCLKDEFKYNLTEENIIEIVVSPIFWTVKLKK